MAEDTTLRLTSEGVHPHPILISQHLALRAAEDGPILDIDQLHLSVGRKEMERFVCISARVLLSHLDLRHVPAQISRLLPDDTHIHYRERIVRVHTSTPPGHPFIGTDVVVTDEHTGKPIPFEDLGFSWDEGGHPTARIRYAPWVTAIEPGFLSWDEMHADAPNPSLLVHA